MSEQSSAPAAGGAAAELAALASEYWEFHLREHPYAAYALGDARCPAGFFRESLADLARRDAAHDRFLRRLAALPIDGLAGQDRFTWLLLERELREHRAHFAFRSHLRPTIFPLGPEVMVADVLGKAVVGSQRAAEDLLARVATIPAYLDDWIERLRAGFDAGYRMPRVLVPRVCGTAQGYVGAATESSVWYKPLATASEHVGASLTKTSAALRALIDDAVRPAYVRWLGFLRDLEPRHLRDSIATRDEPQGEEYYAFLAQHHTTTRLTPAEIHAIGRDEVARIGAEMNAVARASGAGDLEGLRRRLAADPAQIAGSAVELRERIEVLSKRIERRIPEFFGRIPRMTYGIESIPEALAEQLPPAYAQPNPASGRTSGIHWVTSLPQRCPRYMHVPLALHEAWPGHLMHIALMQEMHELPEFRRHGLSGYSAFIEGWALYCERLGHDFGLYDDPTAHYGRLDMEMWRAVRLVVDTGIHAEGWSRERAIAYMREHLTLSLATIEAEVDRYVGMPGQALAYKIGELRIRDLRRRAAERLGDRLDLRALHDRLLDAGPVTLDVLDEHVGGWIDAQDRSQAN
jgi:uncharacterized protein (DUF885 family)